MKRFTKFLLEGGITDVIKIPELVKGALEAEKAIEAAKAASEAGKAASEAGKAADATKTAETAATNLTSRQASNLGSRRTASSFPTPSSPYPTEVFQKVNQDIWNWKNSRNAFNYQTEQDPINLMIRDTPRIINRSDADEMVAMTGAKIPDVPENIRTTWGDIMRTVYGRKADPYMRVAQRAQERAFTPNPSTGIPKMERESVRELHPPDYSEKGQQQPIDIYVGTSEPISRVYRGKQPYNPMNSSIGGMVDFTGAVNLDPKTGNPVPAMLINPAFSQPLYPNTIADTMAHEGSHISSATVNPRTQIINSHIQNEIEAQGGNVIQAKINLRSMGNNPGAGENLKSNLKTEIDRDLIRFPNVPSSSRYSTLVDLSAAKESVLKYNLKDMAKANNLSIEDFKTAMNATDHGQISDAAKQALPILNTNHGLDYFQNNMQHKIDQSTHSLYSYFSNLELPGQITSAKTFLNSKGLPNIGANMSAEEAKMWGQRIQDKLEKGVWKDEAPPHLYPIMDLLKKPEGKLLFDLHATNQKGSDVSKKVAELQTA
jgi:hypothetical protein